VIISTGQSNWAKEVTDVPGLANLIRDTHDELSSSVAEDPSSAFWQGFFDTSRSSSLMTLNGSHRTASEDSTSHTVVVLPDYTFVNEVHPTKAGAVGFWLNVFEPTSGSRGSECKTWTLPYDAVVLICRHAIVFHLSWGAHRIAFSA
jgi:hypothetical protein